VNVTISEESLKLQSDIDAGIESMEVHPCSICRQATLDVTRQGRGEGSRDHFHGSDWGKCYKMILFDCLVGKKETMTPQKRSFLRDGHLHEESIVAALRAGGREITGTVGNESTFNFTAQTPQGPITFTTIIHTDGIIDGTAGLECKSVKEYAWKNKFLKGKIPETYYGQCQAYMLKHRMLTWFLAVKHRHTSEILPPFEIKFDKEYVQRKAMELAAVTLALKSGQLLTRPKSKLNKRDSECLYCNYKDQCWR